MMFESLSDKLQNVMKKLKGQTRITEKDLKDMLREVKFALLEADVNYKVVKDFIANIEQKALGESVMKSLTPGQQVVKIVKDELVELLGSGESKLNIAANPPTIIMLVGLQGSGKTTLAGKLANYLRKQGKKPLMVACDVYRPAAISQLQTLGKSLNVDVYSEPDSKDVVSIAKNGIKQAHSKLCNVVIVDTAGRLQIDDALMNELVDLKKAIKPHEIMLVVDSMTGQEAVNVALTFNEKVGIDSITMSKLDSDARGGAALSVKSITNKPIKFASVGEKLSDLEPFYPERIASRILGMGDVLSIIDKAEEAFSEEQAIDFEARMRKNEFTLDDYLDIMKKIRKMGSFKKILTMLPGIPKEIRDAEFDEHQLYRIDAIITSMTKAERRNPKILNASRRIRIAKGSGNKVEDIKVLKQDVIEELFEEKYLNNDKEFIKLINTYTNYRDDESLKELIITIYKFIQSSPFPKEWIEENSWTYDMKTENQTILHKAAIANEKAQDSLSKFQELMLTGDTTEGVSKTEGAAESASCDDESGEKVWTVTAYTEQGITCKEFKDGVGTLLWQIDFKNPTDYNKVMDYLDNEKEEDILKYARDKEFWEKLIWG